MYENIDRIYYWNRKESFKHFWYTFVFRDRASDLFRYFNPVVIELSGSRFKNLITPPNPQEFVVKVIKMKQELEAIKPPLRPRH